MQKLVKEYLNELNRRQRKRRKANIAVMLLVVIVFGGVVGILTQYGVAMTEEAKCGMEEHQHVEECYQDVLICGREESEGHQHVEECHQTENVLVCGQEEHEGHAHVEECYQEDGTLVCGMEESEGHQHGEACYESRSNLVCGMEESEEHAHADDCHERQLVCGKEEHAHTEVCRIDLSADVEDASKWDAQYANVSWSGNWGEDLAMAAQKQLGYKESMNNYQIAENGSHKGYTRYGQFMGDVYADWDAAFVNFCLHYARLANTGMFANEKDSGSWHGRIANGANAGYLTTADGYEPKVGDIVFFHRSGEETSTQMGIVSSYDNGSNEIKVIEGNSGNEVRENRYAANDGRIFAYLKVTEMERAYKHIGEDAVGTEGTEPGEDANENENLGTEGADGVNPEVEDVDGEDSTNSGVEDMDGEENADSSDEDGENVELGTENKEAGTENGDLEAEGGNDMNAEEEEEIPAAVVEELEKSPAYEASYEDDMGTIHVAAGAGTIPEGAELSVKKIEPVMTTADLNDEEVVDAREINDQYELTAKKLLEESEKNNTTLEGFLAYDISFLVDGVEVEPNGPVKVTMDFNEAVKPEGVSENATVAVNHLKEDATAEDGVVVEDLTEKAATTITTKEEEVAVEKVELVTGSFSVFVVKWGTFEIPKNVECMDEDGDDVDLGIGEVTITTIKGKKELIELFGLEPVDKDGFVYEPVKVMLYATSSPQLEVGREVSSVEYMNDTWNFYSTSELVYSGDNMGMSEQIIKFRVIYHKSASSIKGGLKIDNKIMEDGNLQPLLEGDLVAQYEAAIADEQEVKYVWYKKINGGEEKRVSNNGRNNMAEDGTWLNVALDDGALNTSQLNVEYRVELQIADKVVAKSESFSIEYYNEVQNGSFEDPIVRDQNGWSDFPQEQVTGWNTTATNPKTNSRDIEIARVYEWEFEGQIGTRIGDLYTEADYLTYAAADKVQFAELNAESVGSLYQDVLTAKGIRLNYHFAHRARCIKGNSANTDSMYLVIVPTVVARVGLEGKLENPETWNEIDTQEEVKELIRRKAEFPGVYVQEYTATTSGWAEHDGTYIPEYDLNRFFFVSNKENYADAGNFLDDVWFSQYLPAPKEDTFSFRINKKIMGIDVEGKNDAEKLANLKNNFIKDLKFEITITDKFTNEPVTTIKEIPSSLSATDFRMEWSYNISEGSWVGIARFDNIEIPEGIEYTISVTEQNADIGDYRRDTSVTVVGSKMEALSEVDTSTIGVTGSVDVSKDVNRGLRFTNVYSQNTSYDWEVVKCSSTDATNLLAGAEFVLKQGDNIVAVGISQKATSEVGKGVVKWTWASSANKDELNGDYILSETKAPNGFVSTTESLTLKFKDGELETIESSSSESGHIKVELDTNTNKYTILIKNDVEFYELPSTGGAGIYLYMFGGVLLMAAAALITYRNKRREVLRS